MEASILENTKEVLGLSKDYDAFDTQLLTHINYTLGVLAQIGVAPIDGYVVVDEGSKWEDFGLTDSQVGLLRTYIALKVRAIFDPPQTGFLSNALNDQIQELETRLSYSIESPPLRVPPQNSPGSTPPTSDGVTGHGSSLLLGGM